MQFKNKKVLVSGLGKSGVSASILLSNLGARVTIQDLNHLKNEDVKNMLVKHNINILTGENPSFELIDDMDIMVVSPGLPLYLDFVTYAMKKIPVISEIELAYLNCNAPIIAITGTNGKTTTTSLVGHILKQCRNTHIVGNIGTPFAENVVNMNDDDIVVAELSSFQLETIDKFKPKICAVLNITEDHLNRHKTMENYILAKERIFENQTEHDFLILNYDDEVCRKMSEKTKAKVMFFSKDCELRESVYFKNGVIFVKDKPFIRSEDLKIVGLHNVQNVMAGILMCLAYGIDLDIIKNGVLSFEAVEHRIEFVKNVRGVDYYNDSKGTNIDATINAIKAMTKPTFLILGGSDKNSSFDELIKNIDTSDNMKEIVLFGEVKYKIEELLKTKLSNTHPNIVIKETLFDVVSYCYSSAENGDTVLLSPACASFDMFKNYGERGNLFKQYVNKLEE